MWPQLIWTSLFHPRRGLPSKQMRKTSPQPKTNRKTSTLFPMPETTKGSQSELTTKKNQSYEIVNSKRIHELSVAYKNAKDTQT